MRETGYNKKTIKKRKKDAGKCRNFIAICILNSINFAWRETVSGDSQTDRQADATVATAKHMYIYVCMYKYICIYPYLYIAQEWMRGCSWVTGRH